MKRYYRIIQVEDYFIPQYKPCFFGFWRGLCTDSLEWLFYKNQLKYCMHVNKADALSTIDNHKKNIKSKKTTLIHKETFKL